MLSSRDSASDSKHTLSAKQATSILKKLVEDARTLPGVAWDSPKRTQWKDTARSALERAGLGESLLRSFDGSQAFSVGSKTTDEQLRKQANSSLASTVAVVQSAIDQLAWSPEDIVERIKRKPSHPGLVDSLIIIFVSVALVIFLLWATARTLGLVTFENLPSWLQGSYKAMWTSIAAGTAGIGLAVFKALTRKEDEPRQNYLLYIAITIAFLLGLIFILPQFFKNQPPPQVVVSPKRKPQSAFPELMTGIFVGHLDTAGPGSTEVKFNLQPEGTILYDDDIAYIQTTHGTERYSLDEKLDEMVVSSSSITFKIGVPEKGFLVRHRCLLTLASDGNIEVVIFNDPKTDIPEKGGQYAWGKVHRF